MLHCIASANLFFTLKQEPEALPTAFAVILSPYKGSPDDVRGPIFEVFRYPNRSITAAQRSQTSRFSVGFSGRNSEQTRKQPKEVFSRKHRANCLKAVPNYWCKIAKHCKQILLPEKNVYPSTWKETNVARTFESISSRSLTRADENGSGNIEIGLGYRRRARVSLSLGSYKTDNPK